MFIIFVRILVVYIAVIVMLRLMGKRQVSEFQPFELAVTILIADLAAQPLSDVNMPLLNGIIPIVSLVVMQGTISLITTNSRKLRRFLCGTPAIIIENGEIKQDKIKDMMLSVDDIIEILRSNESPALSDIACAVVETNGEANIIKNDDEGIIITLIENGRIVEKNFSERTINREELKQSLRDNGYESEEEIFWAFYSSGKLTIIKKESDK